MNSGQNFFSNALQGFNGTLDAFDRIDQRKTQADDKQKRELLFKQSQEDRTRTLERNQTLSTREDELYSEKKQDRQTERDQQELLMPIEVAYKEAQLDGSLTGSLLNKANLRIANQKARANEASGHVREAWTLAQGGDFDGAHEAFKKLGDYGIDTDKMSTEAVEFANDTMERLVSGQLSMGSDEARKLAQQVLQPALVMSGRDPAKWGIEGLVENKERSGYYAVALKDRETGEIIKPGTIAADSSEDDPLMEINIRDLMTATGSYITISKGVIETQIKGAGARYGADLSPSTSALEVAETRAKIEKMGAETQKIRSEMTDQDHEAFVKSYDEMPGSQLIAEYLASKPDFSEDQAIETISSVRDIQEKSPRLSVPEAIKVHEAKLELASVVEQHTAAAIQDHPDIEPKVLAKLVEDVQHMRITHQQYNRRITTLQKRADSKRGRNDVRALNKMEKYRSEGPLEKPTPLTSKRW